MQPRYKLFDIIPLIIGVMSLLLFLCSLEFSQHFGTKVYNWWPGLMVAAWALMILGFLTGLVIFFLQRRRKGNSLWLLIAAIIAPFVLTPLYFTITAFLSLGLK